MTELDRTDACIDRAALMDAVRRDDQGARRYLRALARRSFFFLTKALVGYFYVPNLMDSDVFKARSDWVQHIMTDGKRGLLEDPRGHGKTWGSDVPGPIWLSTLVPNEQYDDPAEVRRARAFLETRQHLKGPDSRLVLVSDSVGQASKWVGSSLIIWEQNPIIRWLFPDRLWPNTNRLPKGYHWSADRDGYFLRGRVNPALSDAFLRPIGLESKEQGGRSDGLFIDDLIGDNSWNSPTEVMRRCSFIDTISNLLENKDPRSPQGGFILIIGNRWTLNDVNSKVHDQLTHYEIWRRAVYRCMIHGAGNCGRWKSDVKNKCTPTTIPLWTARYPDADSVARLEQDCGDPAVFAAQYLNDPTVAADLQESKFVPFSMEVTILPGTTSAETVRRGWSCILGAGDGRPAQSVVPLETLTSHVISIDPAASKDPTSANTAVSWLAIDRASRMRFWLDEAAGTWSSDESIDEIYKFILRVMEKLKTTPHGTRPPRILCEKVGAQDYVGTALSQRARLATEAEQQVLGGARIPQVEMVPVPRGVRKEDRNRRAFGNILGQGLIALRTGLAGPRTETRRFPHGTMDRIDTFTQAEVHVFSSMGVSRSADAQRRRRQRERQARIAFADSTGAPLA